VSQTALSTEQRAQRVDYAALIICALIWGTTWFAITHQLGVAPVAVSLVYRFALAAGLLFAWLYFTGRRIAQTWPQHLGSFGQGLFTFALDYAFVYLAEERIASAVVAVTFAGMAFLNIVTFRVLLGQRASRQAWIAATLGLIGVGVLSWSELAHANLDARALTGLGLAILGVIGAVAGNVAAHSAQKAGAEVGSNVAWALFYGGVLLAIYALVAGDKWTFQPSLAYLGSLTYLAVAGSVVAFLLYFNLARRRGYSFASYISALTPPIAMLVSAMFEGKTWGLAALAGLVLVLAGQALLLKAPKA
jgi:drug/metabolite transporter (DMT)-like permease